MKTLFFSAVLSLMLPAQFNFAYADVGSDCELFEKAVVEIGYRVESLDSEYRLAFVKGDGDLKNIEARLVEALTSQIELKEALAQCQGARRASSALQ